MTEHVSGDGSSPRLTYSVAIVGELGPVLSANFAEFQTAVTAASTVFQLRLPPDAQLSEIGALLEARGLLLVSLRLLPEADAEADSVQRRKVA